MGKMQYGVFDSVGKLLRYFNTYKQAETFKISCQRYDWTIKKIWIVYEEACKRTGCLYSTF